MEKQLYDKMGVLWENLVAAVCEELQDGTLEFSEAIDDLLLLGFDNDEAVNTLRTATGRTATGRRYGTSASVPS